jgi:hypothetical protein
MPTLGEILAAARRSSAGFEMWFRAEEPAMATAVAKAADNEAMSPTGYVRCAVSDFARFASEEDWAHLTSRLRDSPEPGMACLGIMVEWRLAQSEAHTAHVHAHLHEGAVP